MKKLLTLFCVLLGFGAMASATDPTVDDSGYLDISTTSNTDVCTYSYDSGVATITINAPQWTETDKENAEAYASSGTTVVVEKSDLTEAGLTNYEPISYIANDGDVFYYWDNGLWKCVGWWLGTFNASAYDKVVVTLSSTSQVKVCVQDDTYNGPSASSVTNDGNDELVEVSLSTLTKSSISQVYVQNTVANQVITVKSVQFVAEEVVEEVETVYTYNFADASDGIDIANAECLEQSASGLVSSDANTNDAIAYFTKSSVTTIADGADGVLELYGAKNGKDNGPYAGTVNTTDETPILWTSGKTQGSGEVWYDYFKVNVPEENIGQYITISADYISGKNVEDRYLVVDQTLSDISSEDVVAINAHLASSVSSGQAEDYKATTTYYGTTALTEGDAFYLICSNNVGVYSITVKFSDEAQAGTSTKVAEPEPDVTEIEGYLTVAYEGEDVVPGVETTITVTTDTDGSTTITMPDFDLTESITVADFNLTFTLDDDGAFAECEGSVKAMGFTLSITDGEGTYVVYENGDVKFNAVVTAAFSPGSTVLASLELAVSFTTEAPVVGGTDPEGGKTTETSYLLDLSNMWNLTPHITGEMKVTFTANWANLAIWSGTATADDVVTIYVSSLELGDPVTAGGGNTTDGAVKVGDKTLVLGENTITLTEGANELYLSCTNGVESVTFSATYTAAGATEPEVLTITPSAWVGYDVVALVLPSITYTGQWGSNYLLDAETLSAVTFNPETDDALEFTIEVEDADNVITDFASYIQVELDNEGTGFAWANFEGTTCTFVLDENTAKTVEQIYIKALLDNDAEEEVENEDGTTSKNGYYSEPFTVNYVSITSKAYTSASTEPEGEDTAISDVNVEVTEVARYNLMGQKLSGAEKGINIIVYSDGSAKKVLVK